MPPDGNGLEWQSIKDFRPGIQQVISPDHPPGTATEENTYRCYAVDSGALYPLPSRVAEYLRDPADDLVAPASLDSEEFRIIGLHCPGPLYYATEPIPGVEQNNDVVLVGTEYWEGTGVTFEMARYRRNFSTTPGWDSLWSVSEVGTYDADVRPKKMEFRDQRSNNTDPNQGGPSVTAFVVNGHIHMYPDDTATTTNTTQYMPGDKINDLGGGGLVSPHDIEGHQGRIVIFPLATTSYGADEVYTTNEAFFWTTVNDLRTMDPLLNGYFNVLAGYENASGYQVIQSLTANELLLIKSRGGGLILRGDLQAYDAQTLPFVRSPGFSMNRGANSPLGFIYPVDAGGLWAWGGGSTSSNLTPHMLPDFWRPPATAPAYGTPVDTGWGHGHTTCAQWNEWVILPNNWLFDSDTGAMWRLEDPDEFRWHRYAVNWRGRSCYAAQSGFADDTTPVFYEYQIQTPASSWSWQSQPMSVTYERYVQVREVAVVAQGTGRIKVTVASGENAVGSSVVFDVDDDLRAQVIRQPVAVTGSHVTFRIESDAASSDLPAPSVHELRYGLRDASRLPRAVPLS